MAFPPLERRSMRLPLRPNRYTTLLAASAALWMSSAVAAPLGMSGDGNAAGMLDPLQRSGLSVDATVGEDPPSANLQRQVVNYPTTAQTGTIIIDPAQTYLYYVLRGGKAMRYGIGVGRVGFGWSGAEAVTRKA